ncbi:MFS transporter [Sphingopyxis sp. JAI128]|uniref:MFS transporter n=1 Tax=Sphingopyxis sp. JAI128 TaxID=2723066 RepID=UPI00162148F2|nr:MFS transporter [Sphingopyxis sp. JAI128]MBB6425788.1 MFS family permease [Sphingopyxis sp. JAI128]
MDAQPQPPRAAPATREEYPSPLVAWSAVAVLFILGAVAFLDRQIISLMVDDIRSDLAISDFQISLLQGFSFALCYAVMGLPLGWLVDRFPRRQIIFVGVIAWAIAAAACGLARNFWQLLFARFGVGLGEAALAPAAYSMMSDLFPRERLTTAMSVFAIGSIFGQAIAFAIGGLVIGMALSAEGNLSLPLIGDVRPWQFVFIVTGLPGVAFALLVFLFPEPARRGLRGTGKAGFGEAFRFIAERGRFFTCHFLGYGAIAAIAYGTIAWVPAHLMRGFGWSVTQTGFTMAALTAIAGSSGLLGMGMFVDSQMARGVRDAHFRFAVWLSLIIAVCGAIGFAASSVALFFLFYTVFKLLVPIGGMASASVQIVTPNELRGTVSAIYLFVVTLLGAGTGPTVVATFTELVFQDSAKVGLAMALTCVILGLFAAACFALGRRQMREAVEMAESWA